MDKVLIAPHALLAPHPPVTSPVPAPFSSWPMIFSLPTKPTCIYANTLTWRNACSASQEHFKPEYNADPCTKIAWPKAECLTSKRKREGSTTKEV